MDLSGPFLYYPPAPPRPRSERRGGAELGLGAMIYTVRGGTKPMRTLRTMRSTLSVLVLAALVGTSAMGCKVTSEDIQHWQRTVKGPHKIKAVLLSDRYDTPLRTEAALALIEMDRRDPDGVAELSAAISDLHGASDPALAAIIDGMTPRLVEMMTSAGDAEHDENTGPPVSMVRAKDAAFVVAHYAEGEARTTLTNAVIDWYATDFTGRSLSGNVSAEQVARELGAPAARRLVTAMRPDLPKEALRKIAQLIGELGDAATKTQAAERLVAVERQMESDEFVNSLAERFREQQRAQNQEISTERSLAIARFNREAFIIQGALPAMKYLASQPAVSARLLEIAAGAPGASATPDQRALINTRRKTALQALEGGATAEHLQTLLRIALDNNEDAAVRDQAFDRVAETRSRDAVAPMWPLIQVTEPNDLQRRLRWRAGELVLVCGGATVIDEFLGKLPTTATMDYSPGELEGYATRMSQLSDAPDDLMRRELRSPQWYRRVIALRYLERRGTADDAAAIEALSNDRARTVGAAWEGEGQTTVGAVAESSVAALRRRLAAPSGGAAAAGGDSATMSTADSSAMMGE